MLDRPLVQPAQPADHCAGLMPLNGAPLLAGGQAGQTAEIAGFDPPKPARNLTMSQKFLSGLEEHSLESLAEQASEAVTCA